MAEEKAKTKFGVIIDVVLTKLKSILNLLKDIAIAIVKVFVPIWGGLIISDVILGTTFGVLGRTVEQLALIGFSPEVISKIGIVALIAYGLVFISKYIEFKKN